MVTRAAKDLLRNTLRSTDYHNKLIEEEEMWRHWEMEKGLTMMVSDDCIRTRMRMDEYPRPKHASEASSSNDRHSRHHHRRKRARSRSRSEDRRPKQGIDYHWTRELIEAQGHDPGKWGHSGYIELYPEEFQMSLPTRQMSDTPPSGDLRAGRDGDDDDDRDTNDDDGYPSVGIHKNKEKSQRRSHKKKSKKTKHKRHRKKNKKSFNFETDSETDELRRAIRNGQRIKRGLEPVRRKRRHSSSTDSDVRIIGIAAPRPCGMKGPASN